MNRYSNFSQSQFNPFTMEEVFTVPLAKQAKHDQAQAALDELGLFDLQRLQKDNDLAEGYINDYTSKIDGEVDSINQSGITNQSLGRIKSLARDRQKWMTQGQGKDIKANYDAYVANKTQLDKMFEKGTISADKHQLGLQQALNNYKGVAENDRYDSFNATADTDYIAEALELAKSVPTQERENYLMENGYQLSPDGSTWVHGTSGQKFTKPGAIADIVMRGLGNNSNIMADLEQRAELGLFGGRTRKDILADLALTMERDLSINSNSLDPKITGNKGYSADNKNKSKNVVYNSRTNVSPNVFKDSTLKSLSKIGTTSSLAGEVSDSAIKGSQYEDKNSKLSDGLRSMYGSGEKKLRTINNVGLRPEEITKLQSYTDKMFNNEAIKQKLGLTNNDLNDPVTIKKVSNYISKFQQLQFTQNVINANSSPGELNSLPKTNSTLLSQSNEYIKTEIDAGGIKVYDQESGDLLDENDINKFDKIKFTGYYSPDNLISGLKGANEATMTSPGEILAYKDGKKVGQYYVSRPTSDMDTPEFQAAKLIKNIKVGMVENLGLQNTLELPRELQNTRAYKNINYMFDPDTSLYTISMDKILPDGSIETITPKNKDGSISTTTSSKLQEFIYKMYGINKNND